MAFGQLNSLKVIESESQEPLFYTKLVFDSGGVFYTDTEGRFHSDFNLIGKNAQVSHLGFKNQTITLTYSDSIIKLKKNVIQLSQYELKGNSETELVGYLELKSNSKYGIGNLKSVGAFYIDGTDAERYIHSIHMDFKKIKKNTSFQVYLFKVNKDGTPGDMIFRKTYKHENISKNISMPITDFNVKISKKGLFVGLGSVVDGDLMDDRVYLKTNYSTSNPSIYYIYDREKFLWYNSKSTRIIPLIGLELSN